MVGCINLVASAVAKESLHRTQLLCVGWIVDVTPGWSVRVHSVLAHVAIGRIHEVTLALLPNIRILPSLSIRLPFLSLKNRKITRLNSMHLTISYGVFSFRYK